MKPPDEHLCGVGLADVTRNDGWRLVGPLLIYFDEFSLSKPKSGAQAAHVNGVTVTSDK